MVARKFTVLLEPAEEGGFVVKCLELPVASEGETKEDALSNIKEAIEGYLEVKANFLTVLIVKSVAFRKRRGRVSILLLNFSI